MIAQLSGQGIKTGKQQHFCSSSHCRLQGNRTRTCGEVVNLNLSLHCGRKLISSLPAVQVHRITFSSDQTTCLGDEVVVPKEKWPHLYSTQPRAGKEKKITVMKNAMRIGLSTCGCRDRLQRHHVNVEGVS